MTSRTFPARSAGASNAFQLYATPQPAAATDAAAAPMDQQAGQSQVAASTAAQPTEQAQAVLARLRGVVADFDTLHVVARRGIVPMLQGYLVHPSVAVRRDAAFVLATLASHPENPATLAAEPGLVQLLARRADARNRPTLGAARGVLVILTSGATTVAAEDDAQTRDDCVRALELLQEAVLQQQTQLIAAAEGAALRTVKHRTTRIRTGGLGAEVSRQLQLHVPTLCRQNAPQMEELLQTTRGVISYSLDVAERTVTVFLTTATPALLRMLEEDEGFTGVAVTSETEITKPSSAAGGAENAGAASGPSGYYELPQQRPTYADPKATGGRGGLLSRSTNGAGGAASAFCSDYKRSLVLHGSANNSLAARAQRRRDGDKGEAEEDQSMASKVFSTISRVLW